MVEEGFERNPKQIRLAQYIRGKTQEGKLLTDILWNIANNGRVKVSDRIKAIELLLNRGWGKPKEELTINVNPRPLVEFAIEDLRLMLEGAIEAEVRELPNTN